LSKEAWAKPEPPPTGAAPAEHGHREEAARVKTAAPN
jgi:hypothetical protein